MTGHEEAIHMQHRGRALLSTLWLPAALIALYLLLGSRVTTGSNNAASGVRTIQLCTVVLAYQPPTDARSGSITLTDSTPAGKTTYLVVAGAQMPSGLAPGGPY